MVLMVLAACAKGRGVQAPADAGVHQRGSADVRTSLLFIFPEYRATLVTHAAARLERHYEHLASDFEKQGLSKLGWVTSEDGGWHVAAYNISRAGPDDLTLEFTLDDDHVHRLFEAPIGVSNVELGIYLPSAGVIRENFSLEVSYVTTPARAGFLMKQMGSLLTANGLWTTTFPAGWDEVEPDGGPRAPDPLDLTFTCKQDGARVRLRRHAGEVTTRFDLVTDELLR